MFTVLDVSYVSSSTVHKQKLGSNWTECITEWGKRYLPVCVFARKQQQTSRQAAESLTCSLVSKLSRAQNTARAKKSVQRKPAKEQYTLTPTATFSYARIIIEHCLCSSTRSLIEHTRPILFAYSGCKNSQPQLLVFYHTNAFFIKNDLKTICNLC